MEKAGESDHFLIMEENLIFFFPSHRLILSIDAFWFNAADIHIWSEILSLRNIFKEAKPFRKKRKCEGIDNNGSFCRKHQSKCRDKWMIHACTSREPFTSTWKRDTCQIRLLENRLLNRRWNSERWGTTSWVLTVVRGTCSGWVQWWRRSVLITESWWGFPPKIQKQWRGLQKAAACALTSHRLSSPAATDFNIPLQWPTTKHRPALLSTPLKLRRCHTSQWWASDVQPVAPFAFLLAPKTERPSKEHWKRSRLVTVFEAQSKQAQLS